MCFDSLLREQVAYLEYEMKNRQGVSQGYLIKNELGDVVDRVGRISNNPAWYRDFYAVHNRKPTKRDLVDIARKQLTEGYWDYYGFIPPYTEMEEPVPF